MQMIKIKFSKEKAIAALKSITINKVWSNKNLIIFYHLRTNIVQCRGHQYDVMSLK